MDLDLSRKTIACKGRFAHLNLSQLPSQLAHLGVTIKKSVSYRIDILLVGKDAKDSDIDKARASHATVLTEAEFLEAFPVLWPIEARWQALRGLLNEAFTASVWSKICEHLALWPEEQELSLALDYINEHLQALEPTQRPTPRHWLTQLLEGTPQPRLQCVTTLCVEGYFSEQIVAMLCRSPFLNQLQWLDLRDTNVTSLEMTTLGHAPHLPQLTGLQFDANSFGDVGLQCLLQTPLCAQLKHLILSRAGISHRGLALLASATNLQALESLDLSWLDLRPAALASFFETADLPRLRSLELAYNKLDQQAMETLCSQPWSHHLSYLGLESTFNEHPREAMAVLASVADTSQLQHISLHNNSLGGRLASLCEAKGWSHLRTLGLAMNDLTAKDIQQLLPSDLCKGLKCLDLHYNRIDNAGAIALFQSEHIAQLESLHLESNELGDKAAKVLASSPYLSHLNNLGISDRRFSDGVKYLLYTSKTLPASIRERWSDFSFHTDIHGDLAGISLFYLLEEHGDRLDLLQRALAAGADPNREYSESIPVTILEAVIGKKSLECIECLLSHGALLQRENKRMRPELFTRIVRDDLQAEYALLLRHGIDVNAQNCLGQTLLVAAFDDTCYEAAPWLVMCLPYGVDVNLADHNGRTALHYAASRRDPALTRQLLEAGAQPNPMAVEVAAYGTHGGLTGTPLHSALRNDGKGQQEVVSLLLAAGADPHMPDENGLLPLHYGCLVGYCEDVLEILVEAMQDVDAPDQSGHTALHRAVERSWDRPPDKLLALGANPNAMAPRTLKRPLHVAAMTGASIATVEALLAAGAEVDAARSDGRTVLQLAVAQKNIRLCQCLLEAGATTETIDKYGISPLLSAVARQYDEIVKLLLASGASPDCGKLISAKTIGGRKLKKGTTPRLAASKAIAALFAD